MCAVWWLYDRSVSHQSDSVFWYAVDCRDAECSVGHTMTAEGHERAMWFARKPNHRSIEEHKEVERSVQDLSKQHCKAVLT
jgi:hypothetical protein